MGKKGAKKDTKQSRPFIEMPKKWPGKVSNLELFQQFAASVKLDKQPEFIQLHIKQKTWEFNQLYIILPASATIQRLQMEIASLIHEKSVDYRNVMIFEDLKDGTQGKIQTKSISDSSLSIIQCFPNIPRISTESLGKESAIYPYEVEILKNNRECTSLKNVTTPMDPFLILYDINQAAPLSNQHSVLDCHIVCREPGPFGMTRLSGVVRRPDSSSPTKHDASKPTVLKAGKLLAKTKAIVATKRLLKGLQQGQDDSNISEELNSTVKSVVHSLKEIKNESARALIP